MLRQEMRRFRTDEAGGGTVWGLFWFMVLVAFAGLPVDSTDGFRNKTMLQATADSAALAPAIDLPDESQVVNTAVAYAQTNTGTGLYGSVLQAEDVTVGAWDHETRTFGPDAADPAGCAAGGGVQIFSNATIHTASSTKIDGVQMVAAGDIELGAQDEGIDGISAQSGGNITMTSKNQFGLCQGGVPDLFTVPYSRLVR